MLHAALTTLKGIGKKKASYYERLGLKTIEDLLFHYPKRFEDRREVYHFSDVTDELRGTFHVYVLHVSSHRIKGNQTMVKIAVDDGSAKGDLVFMNAPFAEKRFESGRAYDVYGTAKRQGSRVTLFHPEVKGHNPDDPGFGIVPHYALTDGISQSDLRKTLTLCVDDLEAIMDPLPDEILKKYAFMTKAEAIKTLHFPKDEGVLKAARRRLIYEELFHLQMALLAIKSALKHQKKNYAYKRLSQDTLNSLFTFDLTQAQKRVLDEVFSDMDSDRLMNRLLQGDVGSGKTAVAIAATFKAVGSGYQVAVMAPTEILAKQHEEAFKKSLEGFASVALLSGQTKDKQGLYEAIQNGQVDVLVGTHALLQEGVAFKNLALVITDEQHRFGVRQRETLTEKGQYPTDVLVMSATPIPRTLSLILYGDLDISIIDQYPKGRQPIKTYHVPDRKKNDMYLFIKNKINQGEQVYFVAPLIEMSETLSLQSAQELYQELVPILGENHLALLHGQMKAKEKEAVMQAFKAGKIKALVATTVVEVGIDVPQATMMVITHAERFGLSQLHQLRGRVGRGTLQSYCFLLAEKPGQVAKQRIETLVKTQDGFEIADKDLEIRGPGEIIGTKQHGIPELKIADLSRHASVLMRVQMDAKALLADEAFTSCHKDYLVWLKSKMVI